jgi:hypothetical protein
VLAVGHPQVPPLDRAEKADPYREQILELFARCRGNLVRVHEELRAQGATLSYPALTRFCRRHAIRHAPPRPVGQYDFQPGEEMQHDTSPHRATIGGVEQRVDTASLVLCYSRLLFFQCYPTFTRFHCKVFLTDALQYVGGACGVCMIDNTHVVVVSCTGARMIPAPEMAAFAERFQFGFRAHEKGDANRSARVERPISAKLLGMHSKTSARANPRALFVRSLRIILGRPGSPQEGDKPVGCGEPRLPEAQRSRQAHSFELLRGIGTQVHFGTLQAAVSEPQRHLPDVARRLQGHQRAGVSQAMWADSLLAERRTHRVCRSDMLVEHERESGPRHGVAVGVQKQRRVACGLTDREPFAQDRPALFPEWKPPLSAPLALDGEAGEWIEAHVLEVDGDT